MKFKTKEMKLAARRSPLLAGFTLVELIVVLAIVVITSLVILVSSSRFNSAILLRSLAYQIGLSIREAQLYGVAVHKAPTAATCSVGDNTVYCSAFGVHFSKPPSKQFYIFADINNNGVDDDAQSPTEIFTTQYGFDIKSICVVDSTSHMFCAAGCPSAGQWPPGVLDCAVPGSPEITSVDIAFKRPNPDAIMTINGDQNTQYMGALIVVGAPGGAVRAVSVSLTGQIVVKGTGN